jgi:membrane protein implicated in regulation of membrane protease activity
MSYYVWLIFGVIAFVIEMMIPTFFAHVRGGGIFSGRGGFVFPARITCFGS